MRRLLFTLLTLLITPTVLIASDIKAVIFDFGGVMIEYDLEERIECFADALGITDREPSEVFSASEVREQRQAMSAGRITEQHFWQWLADHLGIELPLGWKQIHAAIREELVVEREKMFELVDELQQAGYTTPLLSNTSDWDMEFNVNKGWYDCFWPQILSNHVGSSKPDRAIYYIALAAVDMDPSECVFIDDKQENIDAANRIGMHGIQFHSIEQVRRDLRQLGVDLCP